MTKGPGPFPYVGWSRASHQFRRLAEDGHFGGSLLIVGEPGIHCRWMAEAYRRFIHERKDALPIEQIDERTRRVPTTVIGISNNPIASGRVVPPGRAVPRKVAELLPLHLDTGKRSAIPVEECLGQPLSDHVVGQFRAKVYIPPLRRRRMDILAILHLFGTRVAPRLKLKCRGVSSVLIHQLLLDSPWLGNDAAILTYLRELAKSSGSVLKASDLRSLDQQLAEAQFEDPFSPFHSDVPCPQDLRDISIDWFCDDVDVSFELLPLVAMRIFLHRCFAELEVADQDAGKLYPVEYFGAPSRWTDTATCQSHADLSRLPLDDVLSLSFPFPKPEKGWPDRFLSVVKDFEFFGATLESLQAGFIVSPDVLPDGLIDELIGYQARTRTRKKARQHGKLTPEQKRVCDLYAAGSSQVEIAKQLGVTRSNVSKLLQKAKKNLGPELWAQLCEPDIRSTSGSRSVRTSRLPTNQRGQVEIVDDRSWPLDDAFDGDVSSDD